VTRVGWARAGSLVLLGAAILVGVAWFGRRAPRPARHVFVNDTADHRFDESIKVSILAAHRRTGVTNAVIISDRFDPVTIDRETNALFARLNLGRDTAGRAILYAFSPARHLLRIEVGYALEGVLPDAAVRGFESAAKSFTFVERYQDFWAELINTVNIQIAERRDADPVDASSFRFLSGGAGVRANDLTTTPDQLARETNLLPARRNPEFESDADPGVTLSRYLESLTQGLGDADLPLLNGASRVFRGFTPQTAGQLTRNGRMYRRAGLDQILVFGDRAVATFGSGAPVLPIMLERWDSMWLIDEPRSWALFQRFEDSNQVFLKFPIETGDRRVARWLDRRFGTPLYPRPRVDVRRSQPVDRPVEFNFFNYYWLERARAALPDEPSRHREDQLWIARDIAMNLGRVSEFLALMDELVRRHPEDQKLGRDRDFYRAAYRFGDDWVTSTE
jgi:hypothetical protein